MIFGRSSMSSQEQSPASMDTGAGSDDDDDDGVVVVEPGSPAAANLVELPERILRYTAAAVFPDIISRPTLLDLKKTNSFLNKCGVRLLDDNSVNWFICMMDPCYNSARPVAIKCTKHGSSNATAHMSKKHDITSNKTLVTKANISTIAKQLNMSNTTFVKDPNRWYQVCWFQCVRRNQCCR